jgi:hypothetical protein
VSPLAINLVFFILTCAPFCLIVPSVCAIINCNWWRFVVTWMCNSLTLKWVFVLDWVYNRVNYFCVIDYLHVFYL